MQRAEKKKAASFSTLHIDLTNTLAQQHPTEGTKQSSDAVTPRYKYHRSAEDCSHCTHDLVALDVEIERHGDRRDAVNDGRVVERVAVLLARGQVLGQSQAGLENLENPFILRVNAALAAHVKDIVDGIVPEEAEKKI